MGTKNSQEIGAKQKKLFFGIVGALFAGTCVLVFFTQDDTPKPAPLKKAEDKVDSISRGVDPQALRISAIEQINDTLSEKLDSLEGALNETQQEHTELLEETRTLISEHARKLQQQLDLLEQRLKQEIALSAVNTQNQKASSVGEKSLQSWERTNKKEDRNVAFEIPAGTVLRAVIVSGVDCSVGVQQPAGSNLILLRPLDNGHLPRNIRVPLKGSVVVCSATAELSTERVFIRPDRLTLVQRDGSFIEAAVKGYIAGEDGREGVRGVVVDRSGQIVMRAAFSGFVQGVGQAAEALASNANAAPDTKTKTLSLGIGGGTLAMGKLTDYYIKRAEQLQPAIQIAAGRVVDIIFTQTVQLGEKNQQKKFELQRKLKEQNE